MRCVALYPEQGVPLGSYPVGLRRIAALHGCDYACAQFEPVKHRRLVDEIVRGDHDVVLMSLNADTGGEARGIVSRTRASLGASSPVFVVGGQVPTAVPETVLERVGADYVVVGDAHDVVSSIVARPKEGLPTRGIVRGSSAPLVSGFPAKTESVPHDEWWASEQLSTSSCPYKCGFCPDYGHLVATETFGRPTHGDPGAVADSLVQQTLERDRWIERPETSMIAKLYDQDAWAYPSIASAWSETVKSLVAKTRDVARKRGQVQPFRFEVHTWTTVPSLLKIYESCDAKRAELADLARDLGQSLRLYVGFESMSQAQLSRWKKPQTPETNSAAFAAATSLGIRLTPLSIHWDPWTTLEEIGESWERFVAEELPCPSHYAHSFFGRRMFFVPGTELHSRVCAEIPHRKGEVGYVYDWDFVDRRAAAMWNVVFQICNWMRFMFSYSPGCSFCHKDDEFGTTTQAVWSFFCENRLGTAEQIARAGRDVVAKLRESGIRKMVALGVSKDQISKMIEEAASVSAAPRLEEDR